MAMQMIIYALIAPCGLRGCKNRPTPFPSWMSYKATKPGLVLFYILACFNCIVAYFMYCWFSLVCVLSFGCSS